MTPRTDPQVVLVNYFKNYINLCAMVSTTLKDFP